MAFRRHLGRAFLLDDSVVKSVPKATFEKNTNVIFAVYSANSNQEQIYDNVYQQQNSPRPGFIQSLNYSLKRSKEEYLQIPPGLPMKALKTLLLR